MKIRDKRAVVILPNARNDGSMIGMIALAFALFAQNGSTSAPPSVARDLYNQCKFDLSSKQVDQVDVGLCVGFLDGFTDALNEKDLNICLGNATFGTMAKVYVAYLDAHPKYLDGPRFDALIFALKDSYPCSAKKK